MGDSFKNVVSVNFTGDTEGTQQDVIRNVKGDPLVEDPKWESFGLLVLYFIYKLMRVYFVIWGYYFTPITALYMNIYYNLKWKVT